MNLYFSNGNVCFFAKMYDLEILVCVYVCVCVYACLCFVVFFIPNSIETIRQEQYLTRFVNDVLDVVVKSSGQKEGVMVIKLTVI